MADPNQHRQMVLAAISGLTVDRVRFSCSAARWKPPHSATATNERSNSNFQHGDLISRSIILQNITSVINISAYFSNYQTSNGEAKGIDDESKIKPAAADRGDRLARAPLMCGLGSKICLPERATELLEAIIEPGHRVVIEGDNQKQADFAWQQRSR